MGIVVPDPLVDLALRPWGRPRAGVIVDRTPERVVELTPNHPIPGPNSVSLVRCAPHRVVPVVAGVRELAGARGLACVWLLDAGARPADLPERLAACGIQAREELCVMALPAGADVGPADPRIEVVDALRDATAFAAAEAVQAAAFGVPPADRQEGRLADGRADPARHFLLALLDGEPAGAGWATVFDDGAVLNGGAVAPRFRGHGVYRALVRARLALARRAGVAGLATQARPDTSAPILARLGFTAVGRTLVLAEAAP